MAPFGHGLTFSVMTTSLLTICVLITVIYRPASAEYTIYNNTLRFSHIICDDNHPCHHTNESQFNNYLSWRWVLHPTRGVLNDSLSATHLDFGIWCLESGEVVYSRSNVPLINNASDGSFATSYINYTLDHYHQFSQNSTTKAVGKKSTLANPSDMFFQEYADHRQSTSLTSIRDENDIGDDDSYQSSLQACPSTYPFRESFHTGPLYPSHVQTDLGNISSDDSSYSSQADNNDFGIAAESLKAYAICTPEDNNLPVNCPHAHCSQCITLPRKPLPSAMLITGIVYFEGATLTNTNPFIQSIYGSYGSVTTLINDESTAEFSNQPKSDQQLVAAAAPSSPPRALASPLSENPVQLTENQIWGFGASLSLVPENTLGEFKPYVRTENNRFNFGAVISGISTESQHHLRASMRLIMFIQGAGYFSLRNETTTTCAINSISVPLTCHESDNVQFSLTLDHISSIIKRKKLDLNCAVPAPSTSVSSLSSSLTSLFSVTAPTTQPSVITVEEYGLPHSPLRRSVPISVSYRLESYDDVGGAPFSGYADHISVDPVPDLWGFAFPLWKKVLIIGAIATVAFSALLFITWCTIRSCARIGRRPACLRADRRINAAFRHCQSIFCCCCCCCGSFSPQSQLDINSSSDCEKESMLLIYDDVSTYDTW